jgi:hypothetical protein
VHNLPDWTAKVSSHIIIPGGIKTYQGYPQRTLPQDVRDKPLTMIATLAVWPNPFAAIIAGWRWANTNLDSSPLLGASLGRIDQGILQRPARHLVIPLSQDEPQHTLS